VRCNLHPSHGFDPEPEADEDGDACEFGLREDEEEGGT
jgi:hypothetical protein